MGSRVGRPGRARSRVYHPRAIETIFEGSPERWDARLAHAVGPQPEAEELRDAYLELLKRSLCDLVGTTTWSVTHHPEDGSVSARELVPDKRWLRAGGFDWPLQGLTMVGLRRLDDLQECVESVVHEGVEGDLIEAGCWRGGASIFARATLDSLGDYGRTVYVADSFQGFHPSSDSDRVGLSAIDFLAVPEEEVRANFGRFGCERGVTFVPGFFEDTLSGLSDRTWSIVRLDADTYDATWFALEQLYPRLSVGGYVVIDDYAVMPECGQATDEFREAHGLTEPLEEIDWSARRWRRESAAPIEPGKAPPARAPEAGNVDRTVVRPERVRIPTETELELEREVAHLRERLAATSAEMEPLRGLPHRLRGWLSRKLRRGGTSA